MTAQEEELKNVMSAERPSTTAVSQLDDHLNRLQPDDHLNHLLVSETEIPWYKSLVNNIRDLINPPKLPPLEVTSKPIPVKDIWGDSNNQESGLSSMIVHGVAITLLVVLGTSKTVQNAVKESVVIFAPDICALRPGSPEERTPWAAVAAAIVLRCRPAKESSRRSLRVSSRLLR